MQRRLCLHVLATSALMCALPSLPGCGFALRAAPNFVFKTLFSPLAEGSQLGSALKRSLESGGAVRVITDAAQINAAEVVLDVLQDQREKVVVGLNASGQVREFQLRIAFKFKLRNAKGVELIPPTEILQQRDISFNETAVLAKEAEEGLLYRDMQNDIVQQIMRRLAAVTTL
jgi:LPS-assembly lipoprotein